MKLDDPFGRSAGKNERDYQTLRAALVDAGIDSSARVAAMRTNVVRNAVIMAAVTLAVVGLVAWLLPSAFGFVATCAIVIGIWIAASTVRGRAHLTRYGKELEQR